MLLVGAAISIPECMVDAPLVGAFLFPNLEVIVVDDCSVDNTIDLLEKIQDKDSRLKILKHQYNAGACAARNTGIEYATGNYIAFNMFLRVDQETEIVLTETSGVTFVDTDRGLQNSARVAFINEGNVPDAGQESTIQPMMNGDSALIWEPNNDSHNNSAITHANQNYGQTITDGQVVPYVGVAQAIADGIPLADTITADDTNFKSVTVDMPSGSDGIGEEGLDFITLQPGVTKIRVYMWIEGQDYDCENGASGSNIAFNMEFAIKQGAGA